MLKDAAELIRSRFDLYYAQVYLVNPSQTALLLHSGTGTVGAELLNRGHQLPLNTASINGRAAIEKRSVVVADTAASATFKPNPLLPDTRSEMAVPLLIGERVVGVLNMQSGQANALNQDILPAFEALAGQLAIAIQNANLLAETEQARAQVEAQARRLTRANWVDYLDAIHKPEEIGFVFEQNKITPIPWDEQSQSQTNDNALTAPITITGESIGNLVVELGGQSPISRTSELVNTVAQQVAQQIENLRLLESAERFRYESEQASRRLTHEGWQEYMNAQSEKNMGYEYNLAEVRAYDTTQSADESHISLPLKVRNEVIGKLIVQGVETHDDESINLASAVAERLSAHIEGLRLSNQTEQALATTKQLAQREQALRQITSAVRGSTDPATILRAAARELGTLLGRKTIVRLTNTNQTTPTNTNHNTTDAPAPETPTQEA
jgi:GAF domain-containing protein